METTTNTCTAVEATETIEQQSPLSVAEQSLLARYEAEVAYSTSQAASSLKKIRDKKLYRAEFTTWEAYVKDRWEYSKSYSHQLIVFAETYEIIKAAKKSASGILLLPTSERQVRPLAKLGDEAKVIAAWLEAVKRSDGKSPTSARVEEVVAEMMPADHKSCEPKADADQAPETTESTGVDEAERQEDAPDADDALMYASDEAQNDETGDASIPNVTPAPEPGDAHASQTVEERGMDDAGSAVGVTAESCVGEAETSDMTNDEPVQQQEPVKTLPLWKASRQTSRAEELAEACRVAVANHVDDNVAAAIYSAVRKIVEQSLLLMAA